MSRVMHDRSAAARRNGQHERTPVDAGAADNLRRAARGDHDALARLYDRHAAVVLSICRSRLFHAAPSEIDDACQETFIRAFDRLHELEPLSAFRGWLYGIARHVCAERARATRRRARHEAHAMKRVPHDGQAVALGGTTIEQREAIDDLGAAIARLDEHEQLAIHLYYLDPDPVAAAREALGVSRSGYYRLLARARDRLAELMRQHAPNST